ncbi:MAG TPA: PepSY-associated TM helix domain-containing protein [Puia sp.]|nr:PepSY-associated TM helix domain-containing protein [Puia sp.]
METNRLKRKTAMIVRWLHIYLSMISFAVVFFFAVTGLTLNHAEKFGDETQTHQEKGTIDPGWINNKDTTKIRRLDIVEHLRHSNNIKGECSDFRIDDDQVTVSFKGPGYAADAFINRATGGYDLTVTTAGLVGVINDLHKGRDTGHGWSVFIDISALFLTLVSLSGLLLLLFLKKRRLSGLLVAAGGLFIAWLVYMIWIK